MQMKGRVRVARAYSDTLAVSAKGFDRLSPRIGARTPAKVDGLATKVATELRNIRIVAIEKGNSVRGQRFDEFIFGACDAGDSIGKEFGMGTSYIGDDAPVG